MDQTAIENRLREILTALAEREGIAAAYLFGSVARGTARLGSDVDVGILYSGEPPLSLAGLGLQDELERALGLPIRVVVLNRVAPELAFRILNDNRILVEWDRGARTNFEVNSRNEYWDFEPVLHLYRHTNILPVPSVEDLLQRERLTRS